MSSFPVEGLFRCYSPDCCQLWLSPSLTWGRLHWLPMWLHNKHWNKFEWELRVESDWLQFIRFADLKFWSQSAIDLSSSRLHTSCWLAEFVLVRHWCWKEMIVLLSYCGVDHRYRRHLLLIFGQDWACIQHWYVVASCRACAGWAWK